MKIRVFWMTGSILGIFLFLFPYYFFAQDEVQKNIFKMSGEIRPRGEMRRGYTKLIPDDSTLAFAVSQRTRLNMDFTSKTVDFKLVLQDIRTWGDNLGMRQNATTGIQQAWAEIKFAKYFGLRFGRQEWAYDDDRLLGNVPWAQTSLSHDGALLRFRNKGFIVDLGSAYNREAESTFGTDYKMANYRSLSFLRAEKTFKEKYTLAAIGIADSYAANDTTRNYNFRYTYGLRGDLKFGKIILMPFLYMQSGKDINYKEISAWFGSFAAKGTFGKAIATVGFDYLSGNDATDVSDKKNHSFNTLYATNHKFYGYMDYFLNIPANTKNGGLMNPYIKCRYKWSDKFWTQLDLHYFALSGKVLDPSNAGKTINSFLGSEADLTIGYAYNDWVNFEGGLSGMMATSSMETLKGGNKANFPYWAYLMVTVKPTFFTHETIIKPK